jgi:hypothetical protein
MKCLFCKGELKSKWQKLYCSRNCANKGTKDKNSQSKMGSKNPMFGKKAWNTGIFGIIKHPSNQGKNCHLWRGGRSRDKYKLRRGGLWKAWRMEVFKRDSYLCQVCKDYKNRDLIPHHIKLFAHFIKERFDVNNGVTICIDCHRYLHKTTMRKLVCSFCNEGRKKYPILMEEFIVELDKTTYRCPVCDYRKIIDTKDKKSN